MIQLVLDKILELQRVYLGLLAAGFVVALVTSGLKSPKEKTEQLTWRAVTIPEKSNSAEFGRAVITGRLWLGSEGKELSRNEEATGSDKNLVEYQLVGILSEADRSQACLLYTSDAADE